MQLIVSTIGMEWFVLVKMTLSSSKHLHNERQQPVQIVRSDTTEIRMGLASRFFRGHVNKIETDTIALYIG